MCCLQYGGDILGPVTICLQQWAGKPAHLIMREFCLLLSVSAAGKVVSAAAKPVAEAAQQLGWKADAGFELLGELASLHDHISQDVRSVGCWVQDTHQHLAWHM